MNSFSYIFLLLQKLLQQLFKNHNDFVALTFSIKVYLPLVLTLYAHHVSNKKDYYEFKEFKKFDLLSIFFL